ncbi:phosphotransferase [Bizionia sp. KMM 8389]
MKAIPASSSTLSEKELGLYIIETYGLDAQSSCSLFRTGINHTYFITTPTIKYALRVYCYNWRTLTEIKEELRLLQHLSNHNLSVSSPIAATNGSYIQKIDAPEGIRYVVLFSFAEGKKIRFKNLETCYRIGDTMAKIHKNSPKPSLKRTTYTESLLTEKSYTFLTKYFNENIDAMKLFKDLTNSVNTAFKNTPLTENQKGTVHLDIWYDNLSVDNANNITIFDFDNCGNGPFILDIGYFCMQLFFIETDKKVYEEKVSKFLSGYQSERHISPSELTLIPTAGASIFLYYLGVQAQRFDWSNIFLTENYLDMFLGRIKSWLDYSKTNETYK